MKPYGIHIDKDPGEILEQFRLLGEDMADKKAAYEYLDDMKKVTVARLKTNALSTGQATSDSAAERMALSSSSYGDFINQLKEARENFFRALVAYTAEDKRIEMLRSLESSVRSQLNKLPGS